MTTNQKLNVADLIDLVSRGAGIYVDAERIDPKEAARLAQATSRGGRVCFRNAAKFTLAELKDILSNATPGHVHFDDLGVQ